jgi:ABC-type branched-subunit amino acid transport system ATPase component
LPAVAGVDFAVEEGEVFGIIGPNGAGKSTLLKMISGLVRPLAGTIEFEGRDITGLKPHQVRRAGIAKVLQIPRLFGTMTVRENVTVGALFGGTEGRVSEAEAYNASREILAELGMDQKADAPVASLNLHEKKLLEMATALAGRPRMVLLDEVMAGLNPGELEDHLDIVRSVRDRMGVTVVWVEHVMKAITALADRVLVLNFGRMLIEGTPEVVVRDPQVVEAYLGRRWDPTNVERQ